MIDESAGESDPAVARKLAEAGLHAQAEGRMEEADKLLTQPKRLMRTRSRKCCESMMRDGSLTRASRFKQIRTSRKLFPRSRQVPFSTELFGRPGQADQSAPRLAPPRKIKNEALTLWTG
jgi:hypothetical protein